MKTSNPLTDALQIVLSDGINELLAQANRQKGRIRQRLLCEAQQDSQLIDWLNVGWCEVKMRRATAPRVR